MVDPLSVIAPLLILGLAAFIALLNTPSLTNSSGRRNYNRSSRPNRSSDQQASSSVRRRRTAESGVECQICRDAVCNIELQPCHDGGICERCVTKVDRCPFCRQHITGYIKI